MIDTGFVGCVAKDAGIQCPSPATTYAKVQPIFQARCVNVCHNDMTPDPNNNNMPIWGFKDYDHVVTWQDTIRDSMYGCSMPPAGSGVPLTIEERRAIIEFISCKLPK